MPVSIDDRLCELLLEWEERRRTGADVALDELCRHEPALLPRLMASIESLRTTDWMFESETNAERIQLMDSTLSHFSDRPLSPSHLTTAKFVASLLRSGVLADSAAKELQRMLNELTFRSDSRELASRLIARKLLTGYQAAVLLQATDAPLTIDKYVILEPIDSGGMGVVYKAVHRLMDRIVAIKLLPAWSMSSGDTLKRFEREVKAAASLTHPNIVAAYDAGRASRAAYLVLEYVDGVNLFRHVEKQGPVTAQDAVRYIRQAAAGLGYLHARGIIHRDVKPANLILARDGTVKLVDMGLARFMASTDSAQGMEQELTQANVVMGTVAYMSPEQALDTRSADRRSDVYSLGCTLFYLMTGRPPYHENTGMKTLLAHREQPIPALHPLSCNGSPLLDVVFQKLIAKQPADRFQSMEEVSAALDAYWAQWQNHDARTGARKNKPFELRHSCRGMSVAVLATVLSLAVADICYLGSREDWLQMTLSERSQSANEIIQSAAPFANERFRDSDGSRFDRFSRPSDR